MASDGTLFLDEIGELPIGPQAKILRVLQEGSVRRIGGDEEIPVGTRVITATNRNLEEMVRQNRFRQDLYYRIHVVPILIPPLGDRIVDIAPIATAVLARLNRRLGNRVQRLSEEALSVLTTHTWPGNVRELKNVIQRASILCDGDVVEAGHILFSRNLVADDAPHEANRSSRSLREQVADAEREIIEAVVKGAPSLRQAARHLGVSHTTLQNKVRKLGIPLKSRNGFREGRVGI